MTGSYDKTARVWDAKIGIETLSQVPGGERLNTQVVSPDGSLVASIPADAENRLENGKNVIVKNAVTGVEKFTLPGHTGRVLYVSFSTDGLWLVTGSADNTARVWDATTGIMQLSLLGHTSDWYSDHATFDGVHSVTFSPDGLRIVTAGGDMTTRIWDAKTGILLLTLKGHTDAVWSASFTRDGSRVFSIDMRGRSKVWNTGPSFRNLLPKDPTPMSAPAGSAKP